MPSTHGPLVQIAGPPGTGKTTVLPELIARAQGEVIVDIDEILTDGALLGCPDRDRRGSSDLAGL